MVSPVFWHEDNNMNYGDEVCEADITRVGVVVSPHSRECVNKGYDENGVVPLKLTPAPGSCQTGCQGGDFDGCEPC